MVLTATNGGYTTTPHHRQNRRRERPGTRTRRSITRKAAMQTEFAEGLIDAFDLDVQLPSDRSNPSPLLRHNFDNAWQKWKAREAEQELERKERDRELEAELEREQLRFFGGEVDDDELQRLGILYDENGLGSRSLLSTSFSWALPAQKSLPLYTIRQVKYKCLKRQPTWQALQLNLSLSNLRNDCEIARLLSPTVTSQGATHSQSLDAKTQSTTIGVDECISTPQSLPTSPASSESVLVPSPRISVNESSTSLPRLSSIPPQSLTHEDWIFISNPSSPQIQQSAHPYIASTPFLNQRLGFY